MAKIENGASKSKESQRNESGIENGKRKKSKSERKEKHHGVIMKISSVIKSKHQAKTSAKINSEMASSTISMKMKSMAYRKNAKQHENHRNGGIKMAAISSQ